MKRKQYSIKELRQKAVIRLAERKNPQPKEKYISEAATLMNAYYRLCGLDSRLCKLQNAESTYNLRSTHKMEESSDRRFKNLNERFAEYDAEMIYFGICPTICKKGTTQDLYLAYFYD